MATLPFHQIDGETDWQRIEREAAEQVRAELDAEAETPLVFGQQIAWVECRFGRTDALSQVHRVGLPIDNEPHTTCGDRIPEPARRLPLSPAFIRSLGRCRYCETEQVRLAREQAA